MKKNKILATLALLLISWGAVTGSRHFILSQRMPKLESRNLERFKGDPKGDLWVVEYVDYQCSSCRNAIPALNNYLLTYPSRVFIQVRFYPLSENRYGFRAAEYAECASQQKKFWPFHELLFEEQSKWSSADDAEPLIKGIAARAGLNAAKLSFCLDDPKTQASVSKEKEEGESMGVKGTPTFFVNGEKVVGVDALEARLGGYFEKKEDSRR